jgi:hypothetical protein
MCHSVWFYEEDGCLYILRKGHKGFFGFIPLGHKPLVEKVDRFSKLMEEMAMPFCLARVAEADALELKKANYCIIEDRDQFDYVYSRADLCDLAGRKYHRKRNHIANCLKEHQCEYVPFTAEHIPACLGFLDEWCRLRDCSSNPDLCCENRAIRFMLHDYSRFRVIGGAIKADGVFAAVTFGEKLNSNTVVVHFEKAHPEIDGLYPLINQWFCQNSLLEFEWVNREQDLGLPGLRKAKENYFPAFMGKKYRVVKEAGDGKSVSTVSCHCTQKQNECGEV